MGPQEGSIPRALRPSFVAVGAVERPGGQASYSGLQPAVAPFSLLRIHRTLVNRPTLRAKQELLPNTGAQQQSGWLECIAAGLPRALVIRILE